MFREDLTLPDGLKAIGLTATPASTVDIALRNIVSPQELGPAAGFLNVNVPRRPAGGYVSVTPLKVGETDPSQMNALRAWFK